MLNNISILPKDGEQVIFTNGDYIAIGCYYDFGDGFGDWYGCEAGCNKQSYNDVTGWLPISKIKELVNG